ncbi:MAG TPA: hypothetical protein PKC42_04045 [Candidatus Nanoperiomorbaceae bacterium]|nr:hypothetical protein [Candidatus Nanoperiomorbaceae bacterium]
MKKAKNMPYQKGWRRDYAAESLKRHELNRWASDPSLQWTEFAVECGEVATLAQRVGQEIENEKIASIAKTVLDTINDHERRGVRSYRKITNKQRRALAVVLLEQFGSARGIAAEIWGLTDEEINNADA